MESVDPKAQITVLADSYQGRKLNSPNDLVYKSDGSLYFTDPPYGLPTQSDDDPQKELQVNGVYRIPGARQQKPGASPDRDRLQLVIKDLARPNGLAFSPDEKFLYIAESGKRLWMRYRVLADGSLIDGRVFLDASTDPAEGGPDGLRVDRAGNIYGSGPGGVWIISPEGRHIGTIKVPERVSNVAWGDDDGMTLYITASICKRERASGRSALGHYGSVSEAAEQETPSIPQNLFCLRAPAAPRESVRSGRRDCDRE